MQFKNPEILWGLFLLIIPILIHLFQLQKFKKTVFTNVAFLQNIISQTRKSSKLKKWLILCTRLLGLLAIVLSFSQPYYGTKNLTSKQHNFIYLDNSLSLKANGKKGELLKASAQEIIESISEEDNFSLLTNDDFYQNISSEELKKILLSIKYSSKKLKIEEILINSKLDFNNKIKTSNKNILISDFQDIYKNNFTNVNSNFTLIKQEAEVKNNLEIDSLWINDIKEDNFKININIKNTGISKKEIPIAIYNNENLISKQLFSIEEDNFKKLFFTVRKSNDFIGKIKITFSDTFNFDNTYYFTLNPTSKINVLSIGKPSNYLQRIYTNKEFNFKQNSEKSINYNELNKQQLIILNEIKEIPQTLNSKISEHIKDGGHLIIIPNESSEINSYNTLFRELSMGKILPKTKDTLKITNINYNHPVLKNVFNKKVANFQYPYSTGYFPSNLRNVTKVISYENEKPFIQKSRNIFFISSPLSKNNSNFTNSPLIVPVFYNIGKQSFKITRLYYNTGRENKIDIENELNKNNVLSIHSLESSFIPLQQAFQNSVTITTNEKPIKAGVYYVLKENDTLTSLAFNNPKSESSMQFLDVNELKNNKYITISNSIKETFEEIREKNEVHWLWQWFLALAIVSLFIEILILKFFKA